MTTSIPSKEMETEINDIHFEPSNTGFVFITSFQCHFVDITKGKFQWSLDKPKIGSVPCQFRAIRLVPNHFSKKI